MMMLALMFARTKIYFNFDILEREKKRAQIPSLHSLASQEIKPETISYCIQYPGWFNSGRNGRGFKNSSALYSHHHQNQGLETCNRLDVVFV